MTTQASMLSVNLSSTGLCCIQLRGRGRPVHANEYILTSSTLQRVETTSVISQYPPGNVLVLHPVTIPLPLRLRSWDFP